MSEAERAKSYGILSGPCNDTPVFVEAVHLSSAEQEFRKAMADHAID
jgi:hypothetical protein